MREMPREGFYTHKTIPNYAVYSTGTKSANMYYSAEFHGPQWNYLLWTCVPGTKELSTQFDYHETLPDNLPALSVNSLEKMGITKFSY